MGTQLLSKQGNFLSDPVAKRKLEQDQRSPEQIFARRNLVRPAVPKLKPKPKPKPRLRKRILFNLEEDPNVQGD